MSRAPTLEVEDVAQVRALQKTGSKGAPESGHQRANAVFAGWVTGVLEEGMERSVPGATARVLGALHVHGVELGLIAHGQQRELRAPGHVVGAVVGECQHCERAVGQGVDTDQVVTGQKVAGDVDLCVDVALLVEDAQRVVVQ